MMPESETDTGQVSPVVQPVYKRFAKIENGGTLADQLARDIVEIARYAGHHYNTVSKKLSGDRGQYHIVHDIFTALNMLSQNAFNRADYVFYYDDDAKRYCQDESLEQCLVFPTFANVLMSGTLDIREIGDASGVKTHVVDLIRVGRPVAYNVIEAVFATCQTQIDPSLKWEDNIFN